jgi:hypothetical protein
MNRFNLFFMFLLMAFGLSGCTLAPATSGAEPTAALATAVPALQAVTPTAVITSTALLPLIVQTPDESTPTPPPTLTPSPTNTPAPSPTPVLVNRVLIISVDGLRPDAISAELTPHIWNLAQTGAYSWAAQTISPSLTLPSHTSMLTGVDFAQHGVWWNDDGANQPPITTPSLFTYATEAGLRSLAVYGKTKMLQIAQPEITTQSIFALGDVGVSMRFGQLLAEEEPFEVMVVHLPEVDGTGHATGWMSESYLAAVAQADTAVGTILQALADNGLRQTTTVILTADHGGLDTGHSDATIAVIRTIPWIINGPAAVGDGLALTSPIATYDTAATALAILRLPLPATLDGQPVWEALSLP